MTGKMLFFNTGMTTGGAERVIATIANEFSDLGTEVVIAVLKGDESEYPLRHAVSFRSAGLHPGIRRLVGAMRFYRSLIAEQRPAAVASFSAKSDIIAILCKILFRLPTRLVVSDRADPRNRARSMQLLLNFLYHWADLVVCQSNGVAEYYRRHVQRTPVAIIPNPLDIAAVADVHIGARKKVVVCVGRLAEQKNQTLAIQAFQRVRDAIPDVRLKIYGEGPDQSRLQDLISQVGLQSEVTLEGVVPNALRANADAALLLFTSNYEGYPNVLLEAAASGIPIVTTDFSPGTAREIVEDGVNGFVVPVGDLDAVADAATRVVNGSLEPHRIRESARRVRNQHLIGPIAQAWNGALDIDARHPHL